MRNNSNGLEASAEWLFKSENYVPQEDKDTFINKSILSFLRLIAQIRAQDKKVDRFRANPFFRVLFTLMLIVFVSISQNFCFIYIVIAYLLIILCFLPGKDIIKALHVSIITALFSVIVLLPALFYGNTYSIFMIPTKIFVSVLAVNILSSTTRWDYIIISLKRFHLQDLFIFVLDVTFKYIVMLGEFSVEMLYALKLRSVGSNNNKYRSLSGVIGTIFLKTRDMADDMHLAMQCRGFTGEYHIYQKFEFHFADFIYILINTGIIIFFLYQL